MRNAVLAMAMGLGVIHSGEAFSATFAKECSDIPACARAVSELTGQQYVFDKDVKGTATGTPNVELTKENADRLFTFLLHVNGFSRVLMNGNAEAGSYQILRERDARDTLLPKFDASLESEPVLPQTFDLGTLRYRARHPESIGAMARVVRSFMPANSRVIPSALSGELIVTASMPDLRNVYEHLRAIDRPSTASSPACGDAS